MRRVSIFGASSRRRELARIEHRQRRTMQYQQIAVECITNEQRHQDRYPDEKEDLTCYYLDAWKRCESELAYLRAQIRQLHCHVSVVHTITRRPAAARSRRRRPSRRIARTSSATSDGSSSDPPRPPCFRPDLALLSAGGAR